MNKVVTALILSTLLSGSITTDELCSTQKQLPLLTFTYDEWNSFSKKKQQQLDRNNYITLVPDQLISAIPMPAHGY